MSKNMNRGLVVSVLTGVALGAAAFGVNTAFLGGAEPAVAQAPAIEVVETVETEDAAIDAVELALTGNPVEAAYISETVENDVDDLQWFADLAEYGRDWNCRAFVPVNSFNGNPTESADNFTRTDRNSRLTVNDPVRVSVLPLMPAYTDRFGATSGISLRVVIGATPDEFRDILFREAFRGYFDQTAMCFNSTGEVQEFSTNFISERDTFDAFPALPLPEIPASVMDSLWG